MTEPLFVYDKHENISSIEIDGIIYIPEKIDISAVIQNNNLEAVTRFIKQCKKFKMSLQSALDKACRYDRLEIVKLLHENGVNLNYQNPNISLSTPLRIASFYGNITIVNYLLDNNVPINEQSASGETAIMEACYKGHLDIVKLLLYNNADLSLKTEDNVTAFDYACQEEHTHLVKYLKDFLKFGKIEEIVCDQHHVNACQICFERQSLICFFPCGHMSCHTCFLNLENKCHFCRKNISDKVQMYKC